VLVILFFCVAFHVVCDVLLQMGGQHLAKELKKNPSLALRLPPGLYAVLCNDEVKAALDAFTQDPILRFTTSFLQEVVAEGCKQKPSFQFDAKGSEEASFDGREEL